MYNEVILYVVNFVVFYVNRVVVYIKRVWYVMFCFVKKFIIVYIFEIFVECYCNVFFERVFVVCSFAVWMLDLIGIISIYRIFCVYSLCFCYVVLLFSLFLR